ncbi:putative peptide methionine sulfoxide reductase oxidoreductase protein [Ralstonia pseudosolanacearum GMI1000]|uniref:Peptide methionine sulfoxide reductase MsrA n=3 Tax=Ralstonia pseudosolanacearum TaxID=1310165 RepID=MSRA_RALN1|nr:RecName: Full=Peptide methionine sulfoxide reductase MsrA; Short=Protein-methionine-S-oxide reductase; AltName: Full=Peptide-methionine (S)-S-oxide reductase; Short=Peptide Met(O) reductase [Ralstonia pseudosolanacearum GMI1000]CAD14294.1 putative peptide methionine sulfoxide reductase oxidoreductase protein [Ralstonia pseudosolanacearum GMI1000]
MQESTMTERQALETAVLGGGCFWCTEAVFQQVQGVHSVVSGYAGGHLERPTYRAVCGGDTGHAEVVRVEFDPAVIPYREILDIFFATHDPTTLERQGNDIGPQYRSAVFAQSPEQFAEAGATIRALSAANVFDAPIVTEVVDASGGKVPFWQAEDEHQNYFRDHPAQGYCAFVISPKVAKFRERFAHRLQA